MANENNLPNDAFSEIAMYVEGAFDNALQQVDVPVELQFQGLEGNGAGFSLVITDDIQKHESYEFVIPAESMQSVEDALDWICDDLREKADDYDPYEERSYYTAGENGAPEEPYLTEKLETIQEDYHKAADLANAVYAYEIDKDKDVYKYLSERLHEDEINDQITQIDSNIKELQRISPDPKDALDKVISSFQRQYGIEAGKLAKLLDGEAKAWNKLRKGSR